MVIDNQSGRSVVKTEALPWTSEGLPPGWSMQVFHARGMETYIFRTDPGASWPVHEGPDEWTGFMIEGRMTLELPGPEGTPGGIVRCAEGQAFSFGAKIPHGWRNDGNAPARMAFTRKIQSK
jgi:quercetin dioxygenase-like cupin family protein